MSSRWLGALILLDMGHPPSREDEGALAPVKRSNRPSSEDWYRDAEVGDRARPLHERPLPLRDSAEIRPDFAALNATPGRSDARGIVSPACAWSRGWECVC